MEHDTAAPTLWGPGFTRFDTAEVPVRDRFDYWRALFPLLDMVPLRRSAPYHSTALACAGDDGMVFSHMRSDATASHFAEGRDERVMLSLFTRGGAQVRHGRGHEDAVGGGFNLLDCAAGARTAAHTGHESLHLSLPRARVVELLGPSPAGDGASFRHLPDSPLAQLLKTNLAELARLGTSLDAASAAHAMAVVGHLAMACLAQLRPQRMQDDPSATDRYLFAAACRYMREHLGEQALTAGQVAHAMGYSRAHLYRLFARHGLSVAGHIRELRLLRSRALLRQPGTTVGEVALSCGYGDLPAFGKAFRRRFGLAPSEWRNEATSA